MDFREKLHIIRIVGWPLLAGLAGAVLLTAFYIVTVGLAQGLEHAVDLLAGDWYYVTPIVAGFGVQIGLFVYARRRVNPHPGGGAPKLLTGAGTGTSTVSMVACCAHHLTDVLPFVGLSGATLFLNEYRGPMIALGVLSNGVAIWLTIRTIRRSNAGGLSVDKQASATGVRR